MRRGISGDEQSQRDKGREERRTRVIEAAMRMALDGGYDAVQMRAVAERADVALGTIYRYFSGKDDLLIAGLAEWIALVRRRLERETPRGATPADRVSWVLGRAADSTDSAPVLINALVTALSTTDPAASAYKLEVEREVLELVEWAIDESSGIDVDGVARVLGHVWYSALTRWVSGLAEDGSVAAELDHAARMLLPATAAAPERVTQQA